MKSLQLLKPCLFLFFFVICFNAFTQITPGVYIFDDDIESHELKIGSTYIIHTVYEKSPAKFIKTMGGFFQTEGDLMVVLLEFNSDYEKDSVRQLSIPFKKIGNKLRLHQKTKRLFEPLPELSQDLDGAWLFATRGPEEGQKRRSDTNTRKTLKFLQNGRFQWIAYDTDGMQFKGTGGGYFTSKDGVYTENIEFFSKDNSRVGTRLEFNYEVKVNDWHHTGQNSKGKPMYEIWTKRGS